MGIFRTNLSQNVKALERAHSLLLQNFFSPRYNLRDDE